MTRQVTTNLRFPRELYDDLRYEAARRRTTLAAVVREAVEAYVGRADRTASSAAEADPLDKWIGAVAAPVTDESVHHDRYLYGWGGQEAPNDEAAGGHERAARHDLTERPAPSRGRPLRTRPSRSALSADRPHPRRGRHAAPRPRRR